MKPGHQLLNACLATFVAVLACVSAAAEAPVVAQDLVKLRASDSIAAALWTRRPDSYTLQIVFPFSCGARRAPAVAAQEPPGGLDRSTFFIGNTIANLRGLDPTNGGCTLTLIDGRRTVPGNSPPAVPQEQAAPQKMVQAPPRDLPTIQVWLLRADGTQIPQVAVTTETANAYGCQVNCPVSGKQYRFALVEGAQAAAVAISVDDNYYIETLQTLEPKPAVQ